MKLCFQKIVIRLVFAKFNFAEYFGTITQEELLSLNTRIINDKKTNSIEKWITSYLTDEKLSNIVVLFLHGFGDDATRATTLFQCKNRLYSIVSIDMPGCGKSSNNIGQPTLQYYCDIVGEFIEK